MNQPSDFARWITSRWKSRSLSTNNLKFDLRDMVHFHCAAAVSSELLGFSVAYRIATELAYPRFACPVPVPPDENHEYRYPTHLRLQHP
jgi:hypothetical protein